ncbi:MAG: tRNA (adenosine(37)-N6)-dimethylallyltransferase MiaA, partial [Flavobacteriaceae bacterium]
VGGSGMYADALIDGLDHFPKVDSSLRNELQKQAEEEGIITLQQLLKKHDPSYYQRVDLKNPHRLIRALEVCLTSGKPYSSFLGNKQAPDFFSTQKLVIQWERAVLYERINLRVDQMLEKGLEEEAKNLYPFKKTNALQTVGYQEWFAHFDGTNSRETTIEEIKKNTRRYAKRQTTWFKKYSDVILINGGSPIEDVLMKL